MRHAVLVLLLALALAGAGCSGVDVADSSSTSVAAATSAATTTVTPATTSTSLSTTTASSTSLPEGPTVFTVRFGSLFDILSVPESVSAPGLEVRVRQARLSGFDLRPNIPTQINAQIDAFLDARRATFVPNPDPSGLPARYTLDFEVLWLEQEAWPVLSIVYTEVALPAGAAEATTRRFALIFDLPTGEPLTVDGMLTLEGVAGLEGMIHERLAETLGDLFCCFEPGELVGNVGVARDGLRVYVDVSGFPERSGSLEFAFSWAEVGDLIDMRQRFLARRVVEQGGCSVEGEGLVLEDQPGLPETVAAKRRAIFEAAVACDFETLGALVPVDEPDGWFWGFVGVRGGSAEAWREYEADGDAPLWFLVRTLNLPYAEAPSGYGSEEGWRGHIWPAAAADESDGWAHIPAEERAGLVALYGEDTIAGWDERDFFFGYRVVIRDDGLWWYYGVAVE